MEQPKPEPKPVKIEPTPVKVEPVPVKEAPTPKPTPVKEPEPVDETVAPDWLVDDDDEKKMVENEGERYDLEDALIIKLMVIGDKELRKSISARDRKSVV